MLTAVKAQRRQKRSGACRAVRLAGVLLLLACFWHTVSYNRNMEQKEQEQGDLAQAAARALAGEPPALHGPVVKVGPLHETRWHPRHTDAINHKWGLWMKKRRAAAKRSRPPSVLSPHVFPGCAVLANHAYRFIFVRHPKCASSALLHHFTLCSEPQATRSCLEPWNGSPTSSVANASSAHIEALWRDYFVFTVVRNPLARAVSSYKFVLSATVATEDCSNRMDWSDFCADPLLAGELCRLKPRCCPFGPLFAWSHVIDQGRCMTTLDGGLAVDYVARMEAIDQDLPHLFAEINARRPAGVPALEPPTRVEKVLPSNTGDTGKAGAACTGQEGVPERHRSADGPAFFFAVAANFTSVVAKESAYCGLRDFYSGRHAQCLRTVRRAYAGDLRLLYPEAAGAGQAVEAAGHAAEAEAEAAAEGMAADAAAGRTMSAEHAAVQQSEGGGGEAGSSRHRARRRELTG